MKNPVVIFMFITSFVFVQCSGPNQSETANTFKTNNNSGSIENGIQTIPILNVFLENSGSMNGYVAGVTSFEHTLYSFLSQINTSKAVDSLSLFYINSKLYHHGNDINDFIKTLEPNNFQKSGGELSETIISDLLLTVLNNTSKNSLSIFISDCIFSPGNVSNVSQYLTNQRIAIRTMFTNAIRENPELGVVIFNLKSEFNGTYFNIFNSGQKINHTRPYYIWIIGDSKYIKKLLDAVPFNNNKERKIENYVAFINSGDDFHDYEILQNPKIGKFRKVNLKSNPEASKTQIEQAKLGGMKNKKIFMFSVGFKAPNLIQNEEYILDSNNYEISDKLYSFKVVKNNILTSQGYDYRVEFTTDKIHSSNILFNLKSNMPIWVDDINDDIGININSENSAEKTYGIKYLLGGIYDAYNLESEYIFKMNLKVN